MILLQISAKNQDTCTFVYLHNPHCILKVHTMDRSGQVRSGQVRSGQVRSGQVRSGQVRSGQVRSGQVRSGQVRSGQVRSVAVEVKVQQNITKPSWGNFVFLIFTYWTV